MRPSMRCPGRPAPSRRQCSQPSRRSGSRSEHRGGVAAGGPALGPAHGRCGPSAASGIRPAPREPVPRGPSAGPGSGRRACGNVPPGSSAALFPSDLTSDQQEPASDLCPHRLAGTTESRARQFERGHRIDGALRRCPSSGPGADPARNPGPSAQTSHLMGKGAPRRYPSPMRRARSRTDWEARSRRWGWPSDSTHPSGRRLTRASARSPVARSARRGPARSRMPCPAPWASPSPGPWRPRSPPPRRIRD